MKKSRTEDLRSIVVLDNIRSVHNTASLFRTCDCAGVGKIICSGTTPTPLDRFGRVRKDFAKVSLGAEKTLAWEYALHPLTVIKKLQNEGYHIVVLEQHSRSVDYKKVKAKNPIVFVLGNEVQGVSKDIVSLADTVAEIPMKGEKESLNVSISGAVALFRILNV